MSLPALTLVKTWQPYVNQAVAAQGSVVATEKRVARTMKNLFKGAALMPWTCVGSSNGSTAGMAGVDLWATDADIVKASAGVAHSWNVLRQTGIASNFEVCFDLNTSSLGAMSVIKSPAAGFTGGSTTARPTAIDEIVLLNQGTWFSSADVDHKLHYEQSSDGQCNRICIWRGGSNECTIGLFEKPRIYSSNWTNPSVSLFVGATSGIATSLGTLANPASPARSRINGVTATMQFTGEGTVAGLLANMTDIGTQANDASLVWPDFPIGFMSVTTGAKGWYGAFSDLYWRLIGRNDADTAPNDPSTRIWVCMGPFMRPWTAGSDVPLLG